MNPRDLIKKKRDGLELSGEEISYIVREFCAQRIPDYQLAAFLMATYFKGMTPAETYHLTKSMLYSGTIIKLENIKAYKVDKHSTGGVGDKISIILAPVVAACGLTVPMISGRALGHTGGTIDKLESIPGFQAKVSLQRFEQILKEIKVAIICQTAELAPADRKMYALRDVTETVESIPLITASILSKKLASGLDGLVMDVKVGSGAFMKNLKDAQRLAVSITKVMKIFKKDIVCLLTNMDQPLGRKIGNALEIEECIEVLQGSGPEDIRALTIELAAHMLRMGGTKTLADARKLANSKLDSKEALIKFSQMISRQGGNPKVIDDPTILGRAPFTFDLTAKTSGYISKIDSEGLGMCLVRLGAGRQKMDDAIDHKVGIELKKKVADHVKNGTPIATVHCLNDERFKNERANIESCFSFTSKKPKPEKLIFKIVK